MNTKAPKKKAQLEKGAPVNEMKPIKSLQIEFVINLKTPQKRINPNMPQKPPPRLVQGMEENLLDQLFEAFIFSSLEESKHLLKINSKHLLNISFF